MVWILIPIGVVIIVSMYLLLASFFVEVDSEIGLYRMRMHRIASAAVRLTESSLIIDLNVLGWKKVIDLPAAPAARETVDAQTVCFAYRVFKCTEWGGRPGMRHSAFYVKCRASLKGK